MQETNVTSQLEFHSPERISVIVELLEAAWQKHPELRLCQLISNLHGNGPQDIFYTEDAELETKLRNFINNQPVGTQLDTTNPQVGDA